MALKFNGTTIQPSYTVKYNNTELKKIIYNGVTVWEKYLYLYNSGNNCSDVHGGFEALAYGGYDRGAGVDEQWTAKPEITENTSYIQFKGHTSAYGSVFTKKTINVTNYNKMYVEVRYYNRGGSCRMGLASTKEHGYTGTYMVTEPAADATMPKTYSLDISKLSGDYYFACEIDGNNTIRVNNIYLE